MCNKNILNHNKKDKKMKKDDVTQFIDQCMTAKELMSKPVNVTFKNMARKIIVLIKPQRS